MDTLVPATDLARHLGITIFKIRRYTKAGILSPMSRSRKDGKTLLFDPLCEEIKLEIMHNLRLDFSLSEVGKAFSEFFGKRNALLLKELHSADNKGELIERLQKEIENRLKK